MDYEDRISDPRLQIIMDQAPPMHVGGFLRCFFGLESRASIKVLGSVEGFCEAKAVPMAEIVAVLEERELLDDEMAEKLQTYFGLDDSGFLLRLQQSAYLDRLIKQ